MLACAAVVTAPLRLPTKFGAYMLPVALAVPAMLAPVEVTTNTFGTPATDVDTLLLMVTVTLLLPLMIKLPADTVILLSRYPSPWKKFALARLPRFAFPLDMFPVTTRLDNVPTEVMFGCAAVVIVAADPFTLPAMVAVTVSPDSVPTEVMFGCAFVVTVPAVPAVPALVAYVALAAYRLATSVVELTTTGAVPVATVEINCPETLIVVPV